MPTLAETADELDRVIAAARDSLNCPAARRKAISAVENELLVAGAAAQVALSGGSGPRGPRLGKPAQRPTCGPLGG
jgi:hypothetical protein